MPFEFALDSATTYTDPAFLVPLRPAPPGSRIYAEAERRVAFARVASASPVPSRVNGGPPQHPPTSPDDVRRRGRRA